MSLSRGQQPANPARALPLTGGIAAPAPLVSFAASSPLRWWIALTALATFVLVGVGGLVTSHGVGMAVPDWPNTYGYNMFFFPFSRWVGGIFYEHTHRLVASSVGLMTTIMALWLFGRKARPFLRWTGIVFLVLAGVAWWVAPGRRADAFVSVATGVAALAVSFVWPRGHAAPKWLCRLGVIAFAAVVSQGVLGGLRVILYQDQIGVLHATLAQLFFALICLLALFTSTWWARPLESGPRSLDCGGSITSSPRGVFLLATCLILAQLILGATMRHQHAGLAIPDFPLAYGKLWPATDPAAVAGYNHRRIEVVSENSITAFQVVLQMVHRMVALAILASVATCAWLARRGAGPGKPVKRLTLLWLGLILVQVLLGALTIWSDKAADVATAHVMVGALSLALGAILCAVSFRGSVTVRASLASRHVARKEGALLPDPRPALAASP